MKFAKDKSKKSISISLIIILILSAIIAFVAMSSGCSRNDNNNDTNNNTNNTTITHHGISWTFNGAVTYGQFATGDYWVLGPIELIDIYPRSIAVNNRTINGSMLNPRMNREEHGNGQGQNRHGFDSNVNSNGQTYDHSLNIALSLPLTIAKPSTIVSSISRAEPVNYPTPQLDVMAVLTVLDSPAKEGDFRPPIVGSDKPVRWNVSDINFDALRGLPRPENAPNFHSLEFLESRFNMPWVELNTLWSARWLRPHQNFRSLAINPDQVGGYGREIANTLAAAMVALQLDYTNEQKLPLLKKVIQYGIDIYGTVKNGALWMNDGGHNNGSKMPMLLAGVVLNDSSIISFANAETHFTFQEDRSIFRVSQIDVDTERFTQDNRPRAPYTTDMIGLAEWSLHDPLDMFLNRRGSNWSAVYRDIAGSSMFGHILVAHLMGVTELWNYPPVFEYMDRFARVEVPFTLDPTLTRPQQYYVPNSATGGHPWQTNRIQPFFAHMWQEYVW